MYDRMQQQEFRWRQTHLASTAGTRHQRTPQTPIRFISRLPAMRTPSLTSPPCDIRASIQSDLHRALARVYKNELRFYESPSPVQRELKILRPVVVPFFYPSIGSCLAPMGCFEKVRTAPSLDELLAPA